MGSKYAAFSSSTMYDNTSNRVQMPQELNEGHKVERPGDVPPAAYTHANPYVQGKPTSLENSYVPISTRNSYEIVTSQRNPNAMPKAPVPVLLNESASVVPSLPSGGTVYSRQHQLTILHTHLEKLMLINGGGKTALALLNELSARAQGTFTEHTVNHGSDHDPRFECGLKLRLLTDLTYEASGTAKTKKEAKQIAAKNLLVKVGYLESRIHDPVNTVPSPAIQCQGATELDGNPIGDLNELCSKIRYPLPVYEDLPDVHKGTFKVVCRLDENIREVGDGPNKKAAKKQAASKAFQKLRQVIGVPVSSPVIPNASEVDDGNPIGDLNELCLRSRYPPPVYEDLPDTSRGKFKVSCRLNDTIIEVGAGTNKKSAKKAAAGLMLQKLRRVMEDPRSTNVEESDLCQKLAALNILKTKLPVAVAPVVATHDVVADSTSPPLESLTEIMNTIHNLTGPKIELVMSLTHRNLQSHDHCLLLAQVASEQHLQVLYQDFPPHLDDPAHKSVLSFIVGRTRHVFLGRATSSSLAARDPAALQALEYLRLANRCKSV